jgi:excisionase family DNA binding protein
MPKTDKPEHHLLSVKELSDWLGIPVMTLYTWAATGKIPHYKIEKRVLFGKTDILKWLERHQRFPDA